MLERDEYRLILARSGSRAIWAQGGEDALSLPRVHIPRSMRRAEQLQLAIEADWKLRAIVLDIYPHSDNTTPLAIAEVLLPSPCDRLTEISVDEISPCELTSSEREIVSAVFTGERSVYGPFSRIGWVQEAKEWISAQVGHRVGFAEDIRQFNATGHFALLRFATTDGNAYWLKATGEPNTHEFRVTKILSELCPEYLPRWIAGREDWNAWLMEDAGDPLDIWTLPAIERAVRSMAHLQQRTIGHVDVLFDAGVTDRRLSVLRASIDELIEYLTEIMAKQVSTRVPRIAKYRLQEMAELLRDACLSMEALEIPDTLVHYDLSSGNILYRGADCVFTDWCEAGIGNPFCALEYLSLLEPQHKDDWTPLLREIYKQCWLGRLQPTQIDRGFQLAPPLAILSYLLGRGAWLQSRQRTDPQVESYARSLARHMDRTTREPQFLEALCR